MKILEIGDYWGRGKNRKKIIDLKILSNGWFLIKTENSKTLKDFKVKVIFSLSPQHSMTPKHAHFLIDFYGKFCADKNRAIVVLNAIYEIWQGKDINDILQRYSEQASELPGYPLEYILHGLKWILEQEDINFKGRPAKKQLELDEICRKQGIKTLPNREGSQLAIALFCYVASGIHPVEALLKANLDIRPKGR